MRNKKNEAWQNRFTGPIVNPVQPSKEPAYIYHPKPNDLQPIVERKIDKQKIVLYANNRVMRMCREFRGCENGPAANTRWIPLSALQT